jgi:hypothetical protein
VHLALGGGADGVEVDLEVFGRDRLRHLLVAELEAVAVDAGAVEAGAVGAQVQGPFGAAQAGVDDDGGWFEGAVVDAEADLAGAGGGGEGGAGIYQQAFFGFFEVEFFFAEFVVLAFAVFAFVVAFGFLALVVCFVFAAVVCFFAVVRFGFVVVAVRDERRRLGGSGKGHGVG